jgi:hypothetical protein
MPKLHGFKVKTTGHIEVAEIEVDYPGITEELGGYIEIVRPIRRPPVKFVMVVDEEGRLKNLPSNPICSHIHRGIIAGDALFLREDWTDEGMDFVDANPAQLRIMLDYLTGIAKIVYGEVK